MTHQEQNLPEVSRQLKVPDWIRISSVWDNNLRTDLGQLIHNWSCKKSWTEDCDNGSIEWWSASSSSLNRLSWRARKLAFTKNRNYILDILMCNVLTETTVDSSDERLTCRPYRKQSVMTITTLWGNSPRKSRDGMITPFILQYREWLRRDQTGQERQSIES